jgi:hypothetical protein
MWDSTASPDTTPDVAPPRITTPRPASAATEMVPVLTKLTVPPLVTARASRPVVAIARSLRFHVPDVRLSWSPPAVPV